MAETVADAVIARLVDWGVDTIFGFPGDGINGLFEALRNNQDKVRFIQVRHEEAAAFAAVGYAKHTGRLGVCMATSGPGGIHLLNGLYDAKFDGQPVLAITGHTFHDLIGTHYQQDVDLDKVFMDVASYNERIMGPAHAANVIDEAVKSALSTRSVAHVTIPKDIQEWTGDGRKRSGANIPNHSGDVYVPPSPLPSAQLLKEAADVINAGSKVAILAGRGCLGAGSEVIALADATGGVIIKALLGKAVVPDDNEFTTGGIGLLGTAPSQDAMDECDTLVILGSSFPYLDFYPEPGKAKCVQVDIESSRIGLRYPADVALVGDCKHILTELLPHVTRKSHRSFLKKSQKRMRDWNEMLEAQGKLRDKPMKPQVVAYELNRLLKDDAIVVSDTGTITTWAARYLKMRDGMQFSASGTLATMANGLPYSIGAAVAHPDRQIVCMTGDGGFTMLMGEMATLVKYNLPVKIILIKNNSLGQIKWEQIALEGNPEFGVELQPIDFATYARACGAAAFTIEESEQAAMILREAMSEPGPVLVQAEVDPNEPPMPGKVSTEQALNFAKALLRGEPDRWSIIKNVVNHQIREVI